MSELLSPPITGSCLCGEIAYQVTSITGPIAHCHCHMCQKFHGAAFSTFAETNHKYFQWLRGEQLLSNYLASNGTIRQFCKLCGSSLTFSKQQNPEQSIEFSLGALDCDSPKLPDAQIYCASKANWIELDKKLPSHQQDRGE